jgi:uncharacterized protein (DUF927 family)
MKKNEKKEKYRKRHPPKMKKCSQFYRNIVIFEKTSLTIHRYKEKHEFCLVTKRRGDFLVFTKLKKELRTNQIIS